MRWATSRSILFLLVAVNLVALGAAEVQRRSLMRTLYDAAAGQTKRLDAEIEKLNDRIHDQTFETLARVQKIQIDLGRANAQLVDIQGSARSSQTIEHEQREQLPQIAARLNHVELLLQQVMTQLSEFAAKSGHAENTSSR